MIYKYYEYTVLDVYIVNIQTDIYRYFNQPVSPTGFLYNKILEEKEDCRTKRFLASGKSEGIATGVIRENLARKKARHSRFDFRICN